MATVAILRSEESLLRHQPNHRHLNFAPTRSRRRGSPPPQSNGGDQMRPSHNPTNDLYPTAKINNHLVMGQVKIIKRGEALPNLFLSQPNPTTMAGSKLGFETKACKDGLDDEDLILCSTDRLGPEPETVQKEIKVPDLYAGVVSPPPSSLPLPDFFSKKEKNNDAVTCDLRRLLKLDMV